MTGDPEDEPPAPDGLSFAPDERDRREASGTGGVSGPSGAGADPGAGAPVPEDGDGARRVDPVAFGGVPQDVRALDVARSVGSRWLAAIVVLLLLVVGVSLLTVYNGREGSPSIGEGDRLPPFAAPLATAPKLEHDAVNFAAHRGEGDAGRVPACSIDDPSVVTSCAALRKGPLVLMMFGIGVQECVTAVDELDRLAPRYPGVGTLAVAIGGRHDKTATVVRDRRWRLPVAYDRDGGLASRLGAPACPFVLFVQADGLVVEQLFGSVTSAELAEGMARLAATSPSPGTSTTSTPRPGR